jgi:hypothetical protein
LKARDFAEKCPNTAPKKSQLRPQLATTNPASLGNVGTIHVAVGSSRFVSNWMVADAVSDERVSASNSLLIGKNRETDGKLLRSIAEKPRLSGPLSELSRLNGPSGTGNLCSVNREFLTS